MLLPALALAFVGWGLAEPEIGLAHGALGTVSCGTSQVVFHRAFTNDDGRVDDRSLDPNDNGIDPGFDKRVGECRAWLESSTVVRVEARNVYPGYTCRFWVKVRNAGTKTQLCQSPYIQAPPQIRVTDVTPNRCSKLCPGQYAMYAFQLQVQQSAAQGATYQFRIDLSFRPYP